MKELRAVLLSIALIFTAPVAHAQATIQPLTGIIEGHRVGGVTVDLTGTLFIADFGDIVWKISTDGERSIFASGLYGSSGNSVDAEGNLLQSSYYGNFITRIDRMGHASRLAADLQGPVGLAVDRKSGDVYVANCNGNTVSKIKSDGSSAVFARSDLLKCPNGIAFGRDETLYVVNYRDNHMLKIDRDGQVSLFATVSAKGLGHLCFKKDRFFVTAYASHELYQVTLDGAVTRILGNGQRGLVNGQGEQARLSFPNGIACDPWTPRLFIDEFDSDAEEGGKLRAIVREVILPK